MKNGRHLFLSLFLILFILASVPLVKADGILPKPTIDLLVKGIEGEYYVEMLYDSGSHSNSPRILPETEYQDAVDTWYYRDDFPSQLNGFADEDGFISHTLYNSFPHPETLKQSAFGTTMIHYGYYPLLTFKIAIVTADSKILISREITRQSSYAKVTFDLSGVSLDSSQTDIGNLYENNAVQIAEDFGPYTPFWQFLAAYGIAFFFELLLLYMLGYRKPSSFLLMMTLNFIMYALTFFVNRYWIVLTNTTTDILISVIFCGIFLFVPRLFLIERFLKERTKSNAVTFGLFSSLIFLLIIPLVFHLTTLIN